MNYYAWCKVFTDTCKHPCNPKHQSVKNVCQTPGVQYEGKKLQLQCCSHFLHHKKKASCSTKDSVDMHLLLLFSIHHLASSVNTALPRQHRIVCRAYPAHRPNLTHADPNNPRFTAHLVVSAWPAHSQKYIFLFYPRGFSKKTRPQMPHQNTFVTRINDLADFLFTLQSFLSHKPSYCKHQQ